MEREVITISSVASPEPRIVTLDSDSNDPTITYGFGSQQLIRPPSLNDINLPPNPFNALATMAAIRADDAYSPQSPEPSIPSPTSTPPMNVSTIEGWDTTCTTTDDATFYTDDEPRRVYWDIQKGKKCVCRHEPFLHTAASTKTKKETENGDVFSSKGGSEAAHLQGMRAALSSQKDTLLLRETLKHYTLSTRL